MATTKLWAIKGWDGKTGAVIKSVIKYVENPEKTEKRNTNVELTISNVINYSMKQNKTEEERFVSAVNCSVKNAIQDMMITKEHWKSSGNRLMWHGYQSFAPGEVTPEMAHEIGVKLAKELYGERFEVVVATHLDRKHIHNHFVINSVSFIDGKKLDWDYYYPRMKKISDRLCQENALSIVKTDHNSGHFHRGAVRAENEGRPTLESIMIEDVDACILKASSMDDFFGLMRSKGYRINTDGKYIRIFPPGRNKCIRLDRRMREKYGMGEAYTLGGIEARILEKQNAIKESNIHNAQTSDNTESLEDGKISDEEKPFSREADFILSEEEITTSKTQDEYFTKKGIPKDKTVYGISACYIRYMTFMGVYPFKSTDSIVGAHYYFREDILKLDKYINECKLLIDNNIETKDDLIRFKGEQIRELRELKNNRSKVQNKIRRCSDSNKKEQLKLQLSSMNKAFGAKKSIVFYCDDIEKHQRDMKRKAELVGIDKSRDASLYKTILNCNHKNTSTLSE